MTTSIRKNIIDASRINTIKNEGIMWMQGHISKDKEKDTIAAQNSIIFCANKVYFDTISEQKTEIKYREYLFMKNVISMQVCDTREYMDKLEEKILDEYKNIESILIKKRSSLLLSQSMLFNIICFSMKHYNNTFWNLPNISEKIYDIISNYKEKVMIAKKLSL